MAPAVPDLAIREGAPAEDDPLRGERYVGPRNGLGQFEGLGKLRYANGETYQGKFLADQQDGRGVHRWPSGASYEGEWIAGGRSGLGKYRFPEGDTYEGEYVDGQKEGSGKCVCACLLLAQQLCSQDACVRLLRFRFFSLKSLERAFA